MDITNKKLADIIPYAKNAKKHNKVQINNFCMEYDPKYADVIIDRWEKFTGEKAVLLNDD